MNKALILA